MTSGKRSITWRATALALAALGLTACPGSIENREQFVGGGPACMIGAANVESMIIATRCATSGCHDSASRSGGLDLASPNLASRLVNVPSSTCTGHTLVVPGDPTGSFFFQKVNPSPACGLQMPNGLAALSAGEIACVRAWLLTLGGSPTDGGPSDAAIDVPVGTDVAMDAPVGMDTPTDMPVGTDVTMDTPVTMDVPPTMDVTTVDATDAGSPDVGVDTGTTPDDTGAADSGTDAAD